MSRKNGSGKILALAQSVQTPIDPEDIEAAVSDWLDDHPEAVAPIDDTAGEGDTDKLWSADKTAGEVATLSEAIVPLQGGIVSPEQFGAKGDGETDDSQAVQDAVDAGYDVRFADNKTYYLASAVNINHDCRLIGGENTVIKTESVTENGTTTLNNAFFVTGTLKKTTTLTSDYYESRNQTSANVSNRFTLTDMDGIEIGDLMEIVAEDQYYAYSRQYYYLGGMMMVAEVYEGRIYTTIGLPFDIENTENVTVKIYSAPSVIFENLHFVSDKAQVGFRFFIEAEYCKNSTVRNCTMEKMWNGVRFYRCYSSNIDTMILGESKDDNSIGEDSYGICIESCTNTTIEKVDTIVAQEAIDLTGHIPNINTYISNCRISAACRAVGIGLHENAYNTVIEDCIVGGMALYGTAIVNRCKFINNKRPAVDTTSLTLYGSHDGRYARFYIYDCEFAEDSDTSSAIQIARPATQNPVQSFANVIGEVIVKNCRGGLLRINPTIDSVVTSNTVERIEIDHWSGCYEIYHTNDSVINFMDINESTFINPRWINRHTDALNFTNANFISVKSKNPQVDKLYVDITEHGGNYVLPEGVEITFTSADASAHYVVCGRNIASNNPADYTIGSVSGSAGGDISFTQNSDYSSALSTNESGNLVLTRPNKTSTPAIYPMVMLYVDKPVAFKISAKIKNIGETNGQTFYPYICIIDADTGKITYRGNGTSGTATAEGVTITHSRTVTGNSYVFGYLGETSGVANAITEISDYFIEAIESEFESTMAYEPYRGSSRIGNGTLTSIEGKNNIMCSPASFSASFKVDRRDV